MRRLCLIAVVLAVAGASCLALPPVRQRIRSLRAYVASVTDPQPTPRFTFRRVHGFGVIITDAVDDRTYIASEEDGLRAVSPAVTRVRAVAKTEGGQ